MSISNSYRRSLLLAGSLALLAAASMPASAQQSPAPAPAPALASPGRRLISASAAQRLLRADLDRTALLAHDLERRGDVEVVRLVPRGRVVSYGDIAGMVTVNDVMEAVIGRTQSSGADASPLVVTRDDGSLLIDGSLGSEPLRPTGKLLLADKVLVVARDAGPRLLNDPQWSREFARAASAALDKPVVRIDLGAMTVSY